MSLWRALMWSFALAALAWAVWAYGSLPERVPVHFGIDGTPDRWAARSPWSWGMLPALGLSLAALFDGIAQWALRNPQKRTINLPQADQVMALPVERRMPVLRKAVAMLYAVGAVTLAAFVLLQAGSYAEALGGSSQAWILGGLALCTLGPLAALVWGMAAVSNEITRQRQEANGAA